MRLIIKEKDEILNDLLDNHAYNIQEFVEKNRDELEEHTVKSMDRLFNFLYNQPHTRRLAHALHVRKNENGEYLNFDKYKINNIKLLVYNLSNNEKAKNTNLINITYN